MKALRRPAVLAALAAVYVVVGFRSLIGEIFRRDAFNPFLPPARALELRLEDGRFAEALPLALDLDRAYPHEPQIAMWLARVHHGLNDAAREADAWESYVGLGTAPAEACPALPEAYARAGKPSDALRAYERCTTFAPNDAEAVIDLGDAYARERRWHDACAQYTRAAELDPDNPLPAARLSGFERCKLQDGSQ